MSFSIEVPAEANPLTIQNLFRVLTSASSTDQQQIKTGAQQLTNWEKQPGFYSSLQSIFLDTSLPYELRYLSVIQFKNGIDKFWRKTAVNSIKKEEKMLIRSRALDYGIKEPDRCLALQNALVVAKIVRYEFPHDWPDALASMLQNLRSVWQTPTNSSHLSGALLLLLYTIKELATGRIMRTRANFHAVAPEILQVLANIYQEKVKIWQKFVQGGGDDEGGALDSVELSLLSLRILRRLIIAGWEFPNRHSEVQDFWNLVWVHFGEMLSFVLRIPSPINVNVKNLVEKHLVQMAKLHLEMAKVRPAGFSLLSDSIGLSRAYWDLIIRSSESLGFQAPTLGTKIGSEGDVHEENESILEKLTLKGLLLLRACAKMVFNPTQTFKYQQREDQNERKRSVALIKESLFTESFVREIMETLVTKFFRFREQDLRDWEEDPDEWERREDGEGDFWEFSIRSCSEKLFLDLVINYKAILVEPLLNVFYSVASAQTSEILLKDSIYAAIGLAAPVLKDQLDFGSFLDSKLVPEVQIQQAGHNVLRRRVAILLGQWLPVKEGLNRPLVYQIFQHLLDKDDQLNDQVVRVTAGRQLSNIINPFEFSAEPFMPFALAILHRLMQLIEEVELGETKLALLNTISVTVIKMENHISPFADQMISLLPPLWTQAGEEYLMKQSVLGILSALVTSMMGDSQKYHPLIISLVSSSVDVASNTRVYLLEDALDLWSNILVETPYPASLEIINLAQHLFPLYDSASENLRKALEITELYIFLIPQHFLSESSRLLGPFTSLLDTTKREAAGLVINLVELLIRSADSLGGLEAITHLTTSMISTNFLPTILKGLKTAYSAHQTTGPNRVSSSIDGVVETDYLSFLSRLALASPSLFVSALAAAMASASFDEIISWLLTEWFSHFDNISYPEKKKLSCLALTALLETNEPWILSRLQELMTVWTDSITDLVEADDGGTDCLVYRNEELLKGDWRESPADERRRKLKFLDPVHRLNIKTFVKERLEAAVLRAGGMEVFERMWVVNVDKDVLRGFGELNVV